MLWDSWSIGHLGVVTLLCCNSPCCLQVGKLLRSLTKAGLDLAAPDHGGCIPLLLAITRTADALPFSQAFLKAMKGRCHLPALLNKPSKLATSDGSPLAPYVASAVNVSNAQLVSLLLEHGAYGLLAPDKTFYGSMLFTAKANRQEVADVLLRHADKTMTRAQWQKVLATDQNVYPEGTLVGSVISDAQQTRDFAFSGYMLNVLASRGADLTAAEAYRTPFLSACLKERSGVVAGQLLQVLGNQRAFLTTPATALGGTPLYFATASGNAGAVKHVLKAMAAADPPIPLSRDLLCSASHQAAPFCCMNKDLAAVLSELLPAGMLAQSAWVCLVVLGAWSVAVQGMTWWSQGRPPKIVMPCACSIATSQYMSLSWYVSPCQQVMLPSWTVQVWIRRVCLVAMGWT